MIDMICEVGVLLYQNFCQALGKECRCTESCEVVMVYGRWSNFSVRIICSLKMYVNKITCDDPGEFVIILFLF